MFGRFWRTPRKTAACTPVRPVGQALPLETLAERTQRERPRDRLHSIYFDFKPDWGYNFRTVAPMGTAFRALSTRRRYWRLGFEYRARASWKRQVWDLHNLGGFCFYLPLLLLSLSGAYYAFEPEYASIAAALTGGPAKVAAPKAILPGVARRSLDEIQQAGLRALPGSSPGTIVFPVKPSDAFTLRLLLSSDLHRIGMNYVYVGPSTALFSAWTDSINSRSS
jgi:hypothetical protein